MSPFVDGYTTVSIPRVRFSVTSAENEDTGSEPRPQIKGSRYLEIDFNNNYSEGRLVSTTTSGMRWPPPREMMPHSWSASWLSDKDITPEEQSKAAVQSEKGKENIKKSGTYANFVSETSV